jgi:hypothetical protein
VVAIAFYEAEQFAEKCVVGVLAVGIGILVV